MVDSASMQQSQASVARLAHTSGETCTEAIRRESQDESCATYSQQEQSVDPFGSCLAEQEEEQTHFSEVFSSYYFPDSRMQSLTSEIEERLEADDLNLVKNQTQRIESLTEQ